MVFVFLYIVFFNVLGFKSKPAVGLLIQLEGVFSEVQGILRASWMSLGAFVSPGTIQNTLFEMPFL